MTEFFSRHSTGVGLWAVGATLAAALSTGALLALKENYDMFLHVNDTAQRALSADRGVAGAFLPGPKGQVSARSVEELDYLLKDKPHVLGAWITKVNYGKNENPVVWSMAGAEAFDGAMRAYVRRQLAGEGFSSAELNAANSQSAANAEAAKGGLISCGDIEYTNIPKIAPEVRALGAVGACRAPLPPFDDNVNMAIVILLDIPGDQTDPRITEFRRSLLQLQFDILNRDFLNREIWIR